jgi:hypothetical protein
VTHPWRTNRAGCIAAVTMAAERHRFSSAAGDDFEPAVSKITP